MRDRAPTLALVGVLAYLGIRGIPTNPPPPEPAKEAAAKRIAEAEKKDQSAEEDASDDLLFAKPLDRFRNVQGVKPTDQAQWFIEGWDVQFVVATVPDPVDSTSGHRFDSVVDAIRRAVESFRFVYVDSYYPWLRPSGRKVGAPRPPGITDVTVQGSPPKLTITPREAGTVRDYEKQPGMLLFRSWAKAEQNNGQLLVVLLVGETATGGIHQTALKTGLNFVRYYFDNRLLDNDYDLHLLGPFFSGSQGSLARALVDWQGTVPPPKRPKTFHVYSGSATALDRKGFLDAWASPDSIDLRATVIPESIIFKELLLHLNLADYDDKTSRLRSRQKVALLHESNTGFGDVFKHQLTVGKIGDHGDASTSARKGVVFFPFPMHVSQVRSGYGKTGEIGKNLLPNLPTLGGKLPIPFGQEGRVRDTMPPVDPLMTAVTAERILAAMLATIKNEGFPYVAITASDIKDAIFLATLVREQCPDSRLLFTSSDTLLSHPNYSYYLKGAVVGSTYPLYPNNQEWSFPFSGREKHVFFPSDAEQGCYNAALALLNKQRETAEPQDLIEYAPPFLETASDAPIMPKGWRPPIWISVIGQNGPQPLAVIPLPRADKDQKDFCDYLYTHNSSRKASLEFIPQYTGFWITPVVGISIFVFLVGWSYAVVLWRHGDNAGGKSEPWLIGLFAPRRPPYRHGQSFYVCVCLAAAVATYLFIAMVSIIPWEYLGGWRLLLPCVASCLVLGFAGLGIWRLEIFLKAQGQATPAASPKLEKAPEPASAKSNKAPEKPWYARHWLALVNAVLAIIMLVYLVMHFEYPHGESWHDRCMFFFKRATNMTSGISSFTPILFLGLGFFWWGYVRLKRLYLLDRHQVREPFPKKSIGRFAKLHKDHRALMAVLKAPQAEVWSWKACGLWLFLFFIFCRLAGRFVPTVEGVLYDAFVLLGLMVFTVVVVHTLLEALQLWKHMRELLRDVARLPMRLAFDRLPSRITAAFGPFLSSERPGRAAHRGERRQQRELVLQEFQESELVVQHALQCTNEEMAKHKEALGEPLAANAGAVAVDKALTRTARGCLTVLDAFWKDLSLGEAFGDPPPKDGEESEGAAKGHTAAASTSAADPATKKVERWRGLAEDFIALEMVAYLSQFFVQLRSLIVFLTVGPLLLLFAVTSYPFQPQRLLLLSAGVLIVVMAGAALRIFFQIERDDVVSRISGTKPNQINWLHGSFLRNVLTCVVPLIGILAATSSDMSDLLRSWLEPLFQVFR